MSVVVPAKGQPRQLDRSTQPGEQVTEEQVGDTARLIRLLERMLKGIAALERRFWPDRVDHEGREVDGTGTTLYRFPHGYGGPVRWWPVDWVGAQGPSLSRHSSSDDNTLVLVSFEAGTLTLRIEASG